MEKSMVGNKWMSENPKAAKKIRNKYYEKNKAIASYKSKRQHYIGRESFKMLTEDQKKECLEIVDKLIDYPNI